MKRTQKGFTLIELMIVVAIIGILAALAIPSYFNYLKRSKVSEGLAMVAPYKVAYGEYWASDTTFPTNITEAGLPSFTATDYVSAINFQGAGGNLGTLEIITNPDASTSVSLTLVAEGSTSGVDWTCSSSNAALSPKECR